MTNTNFTHIFLKTVHIIGRIYFVMYVFNETLSFYQIRMCYHVELSLRGVDIYVIEKNTFIVLHKLNFQYPMILMSLFHDVDLHIYKFKDILCIPRVKKCLFNKHYNNNNVFIQT